MSKSTCTAAGTDDDNDDFDDDDSVADKDYDPKIDINSDDSACTIKEDDDEDLTFNGENISYLLHPFNDQAKCILNSSRLDI